MSETPQTPDSDTQGLPARRAALKMLDAVLRRGETLEQAGGAANGLPSFADRALARYQLPAQVPKGWRVDAEFAVKLDR